MSESFPQPNMNIKTPQEYPEGSLNLKSNQVPEVDQVNPEQLAEADKRLEGSELKNVRLVDAPISSKQVEKSFVAKGGEWTGKNFNPAPGLYHENERGTRIIDDETAAKANEKIPENSPLKHATLQ